MRCRSALRVLRVVAGAVARPRRHAAERRLAELRQRLAQHSFPERRSNRSQEREAPPTGVGLPHRRARPAGRIAGGADHGEREAVRHRRARPRVRAGSGDGQADLGLQADRERRHAEDRGHDRLLRAQQQGRRRRGRQGHLWPPGQRGRGAGCEQRQAGVEDQVGQYRNGLRHQQCATGGEWHRGHQPVGRRIRGARSGLRASGRRRPRRVELPDH